MPGAVAAMAFAQYSQHGAAALGARNDAFIDDLSGGERRVRTCPNNDAAGAMAPTIFARTRYSPFPARRARLGGFETNVPRKDATIQNRNDGDVDNQAKEASRGGARPKEGRRPVAVVKPTTTLFTGDLQAIEQITEELEGLQYNDEALAMVDIDHEPVLSTPLFHTVNELLHQAPATVPPARPLLMKDEAITLYEDVPLVIARVARGRVGGSSSTNGYYAQCFTVQSEQWRSDDMFEAFFSLQPTDVPNSSVRVFCAIQSEYEALWDYVYRNCLENNGF